MLHSQLTNHVRNLVRNAFAEHQLPLDEEPEETILIVGGHYVGRRFATTCGHAIWFLEEEQVKVYAANGQLKRTLRLASPAVAVARAA